MLKLHGPEKISSLQAIAVTFALMFVYSCHDNLDRFLSGDSKKMTRHDEIRKIMREKAILGLEDASWLSDMDRDELRKMKDDYNYVTDPNLDLSLTIPGPGWEIRGPLTIAQVEQELLEKTRKLPDIQQKPSEITLDDWHEWNTFKSQYKEGDEFYFFSSDRISWGYLRGREGYVLIRENEVVDYMVTSMN